MAHLQKFIDRFKAKASKAKQAQSRVKALERMEKIGPVLAEADFTFEFSEPQNLPNPMLAMQDVDFGYPPPEGSQEPITIVRGVSRSRVRPSASDASVTGYTRWQKSPRESHAAVHPRRRGSGTVAS